MTHRSRDTSWRRLVQTAALAWIAAAAVGCELSLVAEIDGDDAGHGVTTASSGTELPGTTRVESMSAMADAGSATETSSMEPTASSTSAPPSSTASGAPSSASASEAVPDAGPSRPDA